MGDSSEELNNKGFTLLEVLIAILILTIVLIPVLRSFYVTAQVNQKARTKLRSTMVAQDIMEGLKGYETDEIAAQFEGKEPFAIISNNAVKTASNITEVSSNGVLYNFALKNLEYQGVKYDADIVLNAAPYTSGKTNKTGDAVAPNSEEMVALSAMDNDFDGMFMSDSSDSEATAISELKSQNSAAVSANITRTFTITLSADGVTAAGNTIQRARVYTEYKAPGAYYSTENNIYGNVDTVDDGCNIRNIYFLYRPGYDYSSDIIKFTNYDEIPVTLYIIKQQPASYETARGAFLFHEELAYRPTVYIFEKPTTNFMFRKTKLCSNLMVSLYNNAALTGASFKYNNSPVNAAAIGADKLVSTEKKNRMFNAVVTVYKSGAAEKSFPKDMKLTTLDSSKIDQ